VSKFADLHIHTYYSDSTLSPDEVIQEALTQDLSCIAITDHDTIEGITPTAQAAKTHNLEVIPAIELSSESHDKDIHMLGYFVDCQNREFLVELSKMRLARVERIKQMI